MGVFFWFRIEGSNGPEVKTAQCAVRTANGFSAEKSNPSAPAKNPPRFAEDF